MTYEKLLELGRGMSTKEIEDGIKALSHDPRFAALAALIDRNKVSFASSTCGQNMAAHHGALAHGAGSYYALEILEGQLRQHCQSKRPKNEE